MFSVGLHDAKVEELFGDVISVGPCQEVIREGSQIFKVVRAEPSKQRCEVEQFEFSPDLKVSLEMAVVEMENSQLFRGLLSSMK